MLFSYHWLQDYIQGKLPEPKRLAELLTMHSFEVSEVKKAGSDFVLDIDVLSNRGHDCFCHLGIAREAAAILNKKLIDLPSLKREKLRAKKSKLKPIQLKIKTQSLAPRYSAILVEGVEVKDSPKWLKEKLERAGIRSINNVVDLTNFVMLETGQPLHAFDYDKIQNQRMILRMARNKEAVITLDGVKRVLNEGTLVIEDKNRLIDLAGIMGGKLSEVDSKTSNIFLQAGNFDRQSIYRATKKLGLSTEASNIYSQGIDPNLTKISLERACFLLKELAGGKIVQVVDIYPKKVLPKRIKLDLNYVERLLGIKIPEKEIQNILARLGFKITKKEFPNLIVEIPTRRLDVQIPEDLIEEIGRIFGYGKIPASFPVSVLIPPKRNEEIFWEDMTKNILKEAGFTEVYNYSFVSENDAKSFILQNLVELENPISREQKYLRPSLTPNLLKNVQKNQKSFEEIKTFELGKVFIKGKDTKEKRKLAGIVTGDSFYLTKGIIDLLLNKLGISDILYDEQKFISKESKVIIYHPKICAGIKIGNQEIGFLAELSSGILDKLNIKGKVVLFDIDFEKLSKLVSEEHEYRPISKFPSAIRDIAVLVPRGIKVVQVFNKINAAGGTLVRDVDLFDLYEGEELPRGKKNLAFHIIYQSETRTLKSKEIDRVHKKIIKVLEDDPEWEVRR